MIDGYPFSDLEAYIVSHYELDDVQHGNEMLSMPQCVPWVICGVSRNSWFRWRKKGYLSSNAADQVGTEVAGHPVEIWRSWYEDELSLCEECHEVPARQGSPYCSIRCTSRVRRRSEALRASA